jgi:hypothetical protein
MIHRIERGGEHGATRGERGMNGDRKAHVNPSAEGDVP